MPYEIIHIPTEKTSIDGSEYMEIQEAAGGDLSTKKIKLLLLALDLVTCDVSGSTITLDFENRYQRMFVGSASFATPKTVAIEATTDTNALVFDVKFNLSNVAAVLTFPSNFVMVVPDTRWDNTAKTFTAAATGKHEFSATFDGTDWDLKVTNQFPAA